jgi:membrane-bound lytic murein transglycosylase B
MAAMKIQSFLQLVFVSALVALVSACATAPRSGAAALAGTWSNSLGIIWTMRADGTFAVDRNHDGKRDIWGTFTVAGDTVTILGTGGKTPKNCKEARCLQV